MKKVKIMLMAILIMALAGGTIAFKANWGSQFCVVKPIFSNGQYTCADSFGFLFCENLVLDRTTTDKGPEENIRCTAEIDPVLNCSEIQCPVLVITDHE